MTITAIEKRLLDVLRAVDKGDLGSELTRPAKQAGIFALQRRLVCYDHDRWRLTRRGQCALVRMMEIESQPFVKPVTWSLWDQREAVQSRLESLLRG
jgi:hypothetical protein